MTDLVVACAELAIMMLTALAMGWRPDGGWGFLGAFGLLLWLRFALIWIGVWLGLLVPNPEAAGGLFAVAFPLTMISSIFVAPQLMPDWLGWVAAWNPHLVHGGGGPRTVRHAGRRRRLVGRAARAADGVRVAGDPDGDLPAAGGAALPAAQQVVAGRG